MTFWHRAGVSLYTSSCELAETCVFGKQSPEPILCGRLGPWGASPLTLTRRSLSRSYGSILPSSFTRVHSSTLGFSPCPPVSALVRAHDMLTGDAFPGSLESAAYMQNRSGIASRGWRRPGFSWDAPLHACTGQLMPPPAYPPPSRLRCLGRMSHGTGILTRCPSATPCGLALGPG